MDLLFVHIPKNAGSSIIQSIPNMRIVHHLPIYHQITQCIDRECMNILNVEPSLDRFVSFAIKRNPYTRFISAYSYLSGGGAGFLDRKACHIVRSYRDINAFIRHLPYHMECIVHFLPQHVFICKNDSIVVSHVFPFEDLPHCLTPIISPHTIRHVNRSKKRNYHLTTESISILQTCYKKDFEIFGYNMSDVSVL